MEPGKTFLQGICTISQDTKTTSQDINAMKTTLQDMDSSQMTVEPKMEDRKCAVNSSVLTSLQVPWGLLNPVGYLEAPVGLCSHSCIHFPPEGPPNIPPEGPPDHLFTRANTDHLVVQPTSPHDIHTSPHDIHTSPHDMHTSPHDIHASPHDIHTSPHNIHTSPHDIHTSPHDIHTSPHDIHTSPHDIHTSPHDIHTSPHDIHTSTASGICGTQLMPSWVQPLPLSSRLVFPPLAAMTTTPLDFFLPDKEYQSMKLSKLTAVKGSTSKPAYLGAPPTPLPDVCKTTLGGVGTETCSNRVTWGCEGQSGPMSVEQVSASTEPTLPHTTQLDYCGCQNLCGLQPNCFIGSSEITCVWEHMFSDIMKVTFHMVCAFGFRTTEGVCALEWSGTLGVCACVVCAVLCTCACVVYTCLCCVCLCCVCACVVCACVVYTCLCCVPVLCVCLCCVWCCVHVPVLCACVVCTCLCCVCACVVCACVVCACVVCAVLCVPVLCVCLCCVCAVLCRIITQ